MINKVILVGNVGADPEVRTLESGNKVARLRLATTERFYNKETKESTETTEWHTITLWSGLAEVCDKYVHKGSQLYIEGKLQTQEYTDKAGVKKYITQINARELKLLGGKPSDGTSNGASNGASKTYQQAPQPPMEQMPTPPQDDIDDLPF